MPGVLSLRLLRQLCLGFTWPPSSGTFPNNQSKCECVSLDENREGEWELSGTSVGSSSARREFLSAKIAKEVSKLNKLLELSH